MSFETRFREKYRVALLAARNNNKQATIAGLTDVRKLLADQYACDNGDDIKTKALLSYWGKVFDTYIDRVRSYGLEDRYVRKFFGLIEDKDIPSMRDALDGKAKVPAVPKSKPGASKNNSDDDKSAPCLEGLLPEEEPDETPEPEALPQESTQIPEPEALPQEKTQIPEPVAPTIPAPTVPGNNICDKKDPDDLAPKTLGDFIGQERIVKILRKEIAIAKNEGRQYLGNILLLGNPGLGKSTLMKLIAKELGVDYQLIDCSQFRNSQKSKEALQNFLMNVARENKPVVIAFDEIHMLNKGLQAGLLNLLESREFASSPNKQGVTTRMPIDNFTFIGATTDDEYILPTIKDRCRRLTFQMQDYTYDELKRIYQNKAAIKGLTITDEAIDTCIPRGRGSLRWVNSFLEGLNSTLYDDDGVRFSTNIDLDVVVKYFNENGIDEMGLCEKDIEILRVLQEDSSGAMGEEVLAARINLSAKKYHSEYEPYLVRIGFVSVCGRGRSITEKGIKYLQDKAAQVTADNTQEE